MMDRIVANLLALTVVALLIGGLFALDGMHILPELSCTSDPAIAGC